MDEDLSDDEFGRVFKRHDPPIIREVQGVSLLVFSEIVVWKKPRYSIPPIDFEKLRLGWGDDDDS